MMALTQENVHYTLNSVPGVMNKSNRIHARGSRNFCQAGGGGGGGGGGMVEARRPENGLDNVFLAINNGFITEGVQLLPGGGGVQRNPYNL